MSFHIVFITAGEWPSQKGLLVSQVLETARALQAKGYVVSWLAAIPMLSRIKRWMLRDQDLQWLQAECQNSDIAFNYQIIPVALGAPWSMAARRRWHERVARRALRHLWEPVGPAPGTILHARSYYAAEIAILLRELAAKQDSTRTVVTSFDMRSLLGPESPMVHGAIGTATYGFIKELEFALVRDSDAAFLPVDIARRQYQEETGLVIHYAPIQGLGREAGWQVDFDARWLARRIGYSGSIGQWNDPTLLMAMFNLFPGFVPQLAARKIDVFANIDCRLYSHSELPSYYDSLLALVIPGLPATANYFRTIKMRCNFFSTKAAEALSRGVPLVVSSELEELATFVRKHDCGIVVDLSSGSPVLPAGLDVGSRELWHRLTVNAASVGASFERQAVIGVYERAWRTAIERRQGKLFPDVDRI